MAEVDVLKEFLVSLGFSVDSASYNKFKTAVTGSTSLTETLGKSAAAAVISTTAAVSAVAAAMDKLYFVSQRTGSSVSSIKSLGYAASQTGGSADGMTQSLENLGHFMRSYPGSGEFLKKLGVAPSHINDAAASMKDLKKTLTDMPFYQAQAYSNILGIDEKTLLSLRSGELDKNLEDYNRRLADVGVNSQQASEKGHAFMQALRGIGAESEILGVVLEDKLAPALEHVLTSWDKYIHVISKSIQDPSNTVVKGAKLLWNDPAQWAKNYDAYMYPSSSSGGKSTGETKKQLQDYFISQGYSPEVAAGIVRRLNDESGLDSGASGDGGQAYGLFQAHKDWRNEFKRVRGHDIYGTSALEQAEFINYALNSSSDPDARRTGTALRSAQSEQDAYRLFTNGFEKPANRVGMTVSPQTTINVSGAGDPNAVAGAVVQRQNDALQNAIRMSSGVPQ